MATRTRPAGQTTWGGREADFADEMLHGQLYNNAVVLRLLAYLLRYKGLVLASMIGILAYSVLNAAIPYLIKVAIDDYIIPGDLSGLNWLTLVSLALLAAHYAANYSHQVLVAKVGQLVVMDLRGDLFWHLQQQSMSFHNRYKVGQIMSRIQNDIYTLNEFFSIMVFSLSDLLGIGFVLALMFILDWQLTVVCMAGVLVLVAIIAVWQKYARRAFLQVRYWISRVNGSLQENLSGVRVVQSMNRQTVNLAMFNDLNSNHYRTQVRASNLSSSLMFVVEGFGGLALAAAVVAGGQMVLRGALEIGTLTAFAVLITRFFDPIRQLVMQFTMMQRAMASGQRVFELMDVPLELTDKPDAVPMPPIAGAITYDRVHFSYQEGGRPILSDINLSIAPGEVVALVGPTGAGKTTMVGVLSRFFDVKSGRILIDGYDVRDVTRESIGKQMGMVLQEPFLFSGTIIDNIRYTHQEAPARRIEEAARAVGIHDYIAGLPEGYETMLEERGGNLSIGQRQLISFARALVADPRILILDEATASVDTETEQLIQQAMVRLLEGRTAVVIAHRLSTVRNADKIVVLDQGQIVEVGRHEDLMTAGGTYAQHYARYQQEHARAQGAGANPLLS